MSNLFHPYDAALRGTQIPKRSDPPGQDRDQDPNQMGEEKNKKEDKEKQNENQKAWDQIKTQVDILEDLMRRIREKGEMNLEDVRRELNGVEKIAGIMESLYKCMLGEQSERREENRGIELMRRIRRMG